MANISAEEFLKATIKKLDELEIPENLRPRALDFFLSEGAKEGITTRETTKEQGTKEHPNRAPEGAVSLEQFIREKNPRRYATEEIPCIVYWAEKYDSKTAVNEEDIRGYYRISGIKNWPARLDQSLRDLSSKKKYGMLEIVEGQPGYYRLSRRIGCHFVEVKLVNRNAATTK